MLWIPHRYQVGRMAGNQENPANGRTVVAQSQTFACEGPNAAHPGPRRFVQKKYRNVLLPLSITNNIELTNFSASDTFSRE